MDSLTRIELAELMASKLCHDLVGPVGATANGAELLADMTMEDEALALTTASANQAAKLLQYYRLAFGAAGGLRNDFDELRSVASGVLELRGLEQRWDIDTAAAVPIGASKLLANLIGLAAEALPRSGVIESGFREEDGDSVLFVAARGAGAQLREETRHAIDSDNSNELTPRNVQARYTALLAKQLGGGLRVRENPDYVALEARLPQAK